MLLVASVNYDVHCAHMPRSFAIARPKERINMNAGYV